MSRTRRDDFATLLRTALQADGAPRRILHLVSGIEQPDTADAGGEAATHSRVARLVSLLCFEANRTLEDAQTGSLIRIVAETGHGAVYCLPIQRSRHLVGLLTDGGSTDAVDAADRVMVRLVDDVRHSIGLRSQNPGGLASRRRRREAPPADGDSTPGGESSFGADSSYGPYSSYGTSSTYGGDSTSGSDSGPTPAVTTVHEADGATARDRELLVDVVAPDRVQWAAVVRGRAVSVAVDCFADPRMDRFFVLMGQDARRGFYTEFAGSGHTLLNRVSRIVRAAVGGPLRRLVLDVEEGAVVLHRLGADELLVGLTFDQNRVAVVERLLRRLADTLGDAVGCSGPNGSG